jgi:hypothetical protein
MPRFSWRRNGKQGSPSEALAAAERLVADDRTLDAIELLTVANRDQSDGRLARRLVELRSDAFLGRSWPADPPTWPSAVPDLFPGVAVPEVAGGELTLDELRSAILHHGTLLVRGWVYQ